LHEKIRLARYIQAKFKFSSEPSLLIAEQSSPGDCFRKVTAVHSEAGRQREVQLYLSPDLKFLSREILDTTLDPRAEEERVEKELQAGLSPDSAASKGSANAPVTLTVFSDFQCYYCAKLANMLKSEVLPYEGDKLRLVYRHLPLTSHVWARAAAEAAACAGDQSDKAFSELHAIILANQRDLTKDNLATSISRFAGQMEKLDRPRFNACVATRRTSPTVEQDIAFAKKHGLTGTPTLFMNGRRFESVSEAVQLRTLIRQNESLRR
jgi:protein-disulfide isomerase